MWWFVFAVLLVLALPLRAESPCTDTACTTLSARGGEVPGLVDRPGTAPARTTPWRTEIDLSDFDAQHDVFLSTRSEAPMRCGHGHATLFLRCFEDVTAVFLWHGCAISAPPGTDVPVELRVDGGAVENTTWQVGGDTATLGLWTYRPARRLAEALEDAEVLALRYEDPLGQYREARFPIKGLAQALVPLQVACGWSEVMPPGSG